jgi:osmotically-inducible protein OsmY
MANQQYERSSRRYSDDDNRESYQGQNRSQEQSYEGNPFSDEDDAQTDESGRSYAVDIQYSRERSMGPNDYNDTSFSNSQRSMSQYERARFSGANQGNYGNQMGQFGGNWSVYSGPHAGKGPKGWKRSDDRIYEEVCQILEQRGDIDPSEVEIKVSNGEVTMEGTVSDRTSKRRLDEAIDQVSGIKDVHNRVRVKAE